MLQGGHDHSQVGTGLPGLSALILEVICHWSGERAGNMRKESVVSICSEAVMLGALYEREGKDP